MRLTTKGRFAVTAMIDLGLRQAGGPVTLAAISQRQHISLSYLEQLFGKLRRNDLVESVANRMRFGVESKPLQRELAGMVNISERTLRRRLERQDTSYRALRDGTRFERARDLLANSDMTVAQVAELVGYSDARAFRRAFKRWAGLLPAEFRASVGTA